MDEIVDLVDQHNQVIGQISKHLAHQTGALHRCIIAEVIDSEGQWTLVKQASDRQDAGQFVSPVGGHIQAGETELEALKREALEEMGITQYTHEFVGKAIYNRQVIGRQENHYFIVYKIFSDQSPSLNHESVSFEKFSETQLIQELHSTPYKFGAAFIFVAQTFFPHLFATAS